MIALHDCPSTSSSTRQAAAREPRPTVRSGQSTNPSVGRMDKILSQGRVEAATMGKKSKGTKKRLAKLENQNSRVPAWVMLKTDMNVRRNPKRRNWRRSDTDE